MDITHDIVDMIKSGKHKELAILLDKNPSLANNITKQGISLLQFAVYCRNQNAVDLLRQYKQQLNIFESASIGDIDQLKELLDKHPELLNAYSVDGFTLIGLACFFGHVDIVKFLISKGADVNIASNNDFRVAPIHSACAISRYEIVALLIKHGAVVNAKQMQGVTPLHSAAHNGSTKLAELLIDNGADVNAKLDNGQTPLFMANEKGFTETAALILQNGGL